MIHFLLCAYLAVSAVLFVCFAAINLSDAIARDSSPHRRAESYIVSACLFLTACWGAFVLGIVA